LEGRLTGRRLANEILLLGRAPGPNHGEKVLTIHNTEANERKSRDRRLEADFFRVLQEGLYKASGEKYSGVGNGNVTSSLMLIFD